MPIPSTLGWYEIPNTKLRSVAQSGSGSQFPNVVNAWSGACFDSQRNRMIIWGGGHNDYSGNEVYALNMSTLTVERIKDGTFDPTFAFDEYSGGCSAPFSPLQPHSRHTYDWLSYCANVDKMWTWSRAWNCWLPGWMLNLGSLTWEPLSAGNTPQGNMPFNTSVFAADYDSVSGKIYTTDTGSFYSFNPVTGAYARVGDSSGTQDFFGVMCMVINPVRRFAYLFGGGESSKYNLAASPGSINRISLTTTGGSAIINATSPGLAYNPVTDQIVAWAGGNTVYSLNLDTNVWTANTYAGGPGAQPSNGTFGRFRYVASLGVFVLINGVDQNAFSFRLNSSTPDTTPPTTPGSPTATAVSPSQINLTWTASTDDVAVARYVIQRCTGSGCSGFSDIGSSTSLTYSDLGLTAGTLYRYRIRAEDAAGNLSSYSSIVQDTTTAADVTAPTVPANLAVSAPSYAQVNVSWNASSDAVGVVGYYLERRKSAGAFAQIAFVTTGLTYADIGLASNTVYDYRVRAADAAGNISAFSSIQSVTTPFSNILQVGSTKPYTTLAAAAAVAIDGDTIEIDPETFQDDTATFTQENITIHGVDYGIGTLAKFKWNTGNYRTATADIPNGQGIIRFFGSGVIENLELYGAKVADYNGAGIRYGGKDLILRNLYLHDCQNGVLGQATPGPGYTLTIEFCRAATNGIISPGGFTGHNFYIGHMKKLVFRYNSSIDPEEGHCLKSRADVNEVYANFLSTKNSNGSLELEFPNGGAAYVVGNILEQGNGSNNSTMLSYGAEGLNNPLRDLYVINNTFYNWRSAGCTFVQVVNGPIDNLVLQNNARNTGGTWLSGTATNLVNSSNDDLVLSGADWVNPSTADFHLLVGSSAIDAGANPGFAPTTNFDLTPHWEYVPVASRSARLVVNALDVGAYEFGTEPVPPTIPRIAFSRRT